MLNETYIPMCNAFWHDENIINIDTVFFFCTQTKSRTAHVLHIISNMYLRYFKISYFIYKFTIDCTLQKLHQDNSYFVVVAVWFECVVGNGLIVWCARRQKTEKKPKKPKQNRRRKLLIYNSNNQINYIGNILQTN